MFLQNYYQDSNWCRVTRQVLRRPEPINKQFSCSVLSLYQYHVWPLIKFPPKRPQICQLRNFMVYLPPAMQICCFAPSLMLFLVKSSRMPLKPETRAACVALWILLCFRCRLWFFNKPSECLFICLAKPQVEFDASPPWFIFFFIFSQGRLDSFPPSTPPLLFLYLS